MSTDRQGQCEVYTSGIPRAGEPQCGRPAVLRYPSMGGSHMRLCAEHGAAHERYCERWNGSDWVRPPDLPAGWRRAYEAAAPEGKP